MSVSQLIWPLLLEGLRTSLALSVLTQRCTQVIFNDDLIRASQLAFAMALLRVCQISGKEAGVESQFFVTPVAARCISLRAPMSLHESWLPHRHSSGWPDVTCYLKLFQNTWCIVGRSDVGTTDWEARCGFTRRWPRLRGGSRAHASGRLSEGAMLRPPSMSAFTGLQSGWTAVWLLVVFGSWFKFQQGDCLKRQHRVFFAKRDLSCDGCKDAFESFRAHLT